MLMASSVSAQRKGNNNAKSATTQLVQNYVDSLTVLRQQLDSIRFVNDSLKIEATDGRYYRLFAPLTFYHSGADRLLSPGTPLCGFGRQGIRSRYR